MGSKYITVPEAAKRLGVGRRTIYRYSKRGLFRTQCVGRSLLILEEDFEQVKKGQREALTSPINKNIVTKLQVQVQTLTSQMATVLRILNIRYEPLGFTVPEYLRFYQSAQEMSTNGWSPFDEEMWADYFVRLTVEDLESIEMASEDKHPWRPVLRLVTTMHLNPYNKHLTEVLAAGHTNVKQVAGMWCVLHDESPRTFDLLQQRDAAPFKKLVRRLKKFQA